MKTFIWSLILIFGLILNTGLLASEEAFVFEDQNRPKKVYDQEYYSKDENILKSFEPFDLDNHRSFLKDFGKDISTELMHRWINLKKFPNDCSELIGSCDYYLCKEKERPCNSDGYFLNFGYVYCSQSIDHLKEKVSDKGKVWLTTVAKCLQEKTHEMDKSLTCKEVKSEAIRSHDSCYSEINFCTLPPKDIILVLNMIKKELKDLRIVREGIEVLLSCGVK